MFLQKLKIWWKNFLNRWRGDRNNTQRDQKKKEMTDDIYPLY